MLRKLFATILLVAGMSAYSLPALAGIRIDIYRDTQQMSVWVDDNQLYTWDVSTGAVYGWTPAGAFTPFWLDKNHHSSLYHGAPMPYSIFFNGNIAIHGTTEVSHLGSRASHGCVRLLTENAAVLYDLVLQHGKKNTLVVVH